GLLGPLEHPGALPRYQVSRAQTTRPELSPVTPQLPGPARASTRSRPCGREGSRGPRRHRPPQSSTSTRQDEPRSVQRTAKNCPRLPECTTAFAASSLAISTTSS